MKMGKKYETNFPPKILFDAILSQVKFYLCNVECNVISLQNNVFHVAMHSDCFALFNLK